MLEWVRQSSGGDIRAAYHSVTLKGKGQGPHKSKSDKYLQKVREKIEVRFRVKVERRAKGSISMVGVKLNAGLQVGVRVRFGSW